MKAQLIERYRHFCRWQQEGPRYVNRHPDTVQHCQNCGTEFTDNFCPRCGQRAGVGRVGWKSVRESVAILWGMDSRSLTSTLVQLLLRPGYLIRDYISGRRQVSYPPVKMLVIVSLFTVIVESVFHLHNEVLSWHYDIPEVDNVVQWFNDHRNWGKLLLQSFFILPTWVVFRFAPRYPRHTLPEGIFLQVFLSTQSLLLWFLNYWNGRIAFVAGAIFMLITYHQLFGYGWWGTLWRLGVTALTSMLMLLPLLALAFLFGEDDRKDTAIAAGPWLLAMVILLISVLLSASYLISRYQNKRNKTTSHITNNETRTKR